jgi:hypothetical protein
VDRPVVSVTGTPGMSPHGCCFSPQAQGTPRQSAQFRGQDDWGESAVDEMVQALEQLHSDAALRRAIGTAGAAFMRGLSWERQTARRMDVLAGLGD